MYFVFLYNVYYPNGGAHDSGGIFDTLDEARAAVDERQQREIDEAGRALNYARIYTVVDRQWREVWSHAYG